MDLKVSSLFTLERHKDFSEHDLVHSYEIRCLSESSFDKILLLSMVEVVVEVYFERSFC